MLARIEDILVLISRTVNMEITVEELVTDCYHDYQALDGDHAEITHMGDNLIGSLLRPVSPG